MAEFTLVMGNRASSSWSLRGWLAMKQADVEFDEIMVWFHQPDIKEQILAHSASGLVPLLKHNTGTGERLVWESLAIIEYLADLYPDKGFWPEDTEARATARSVSAEMHAGFAPLRNHMPMDLQNRKPGEGRGPGVAENIGRITAIWEDCRKRFGGSSVQGEDFLFGEFGAADIMFAPVVTRFHTYGVDLNPACQAYADAILNTPNMLEWIEGARAEPPPK